HISKFRSLLNQLVGINEKVNDDDAKTILFNSLPKKMSHVVFTLSKIKIGLEGVVSTLLDQNEPLEPEEEVLYVHTKASTSSKKGRYNSKHVPTKGKIKCYYCKEAGHVILNCKKQAQDLLDDKLDQKAYIVEEETDWEDYATDEELYCPSDEDYLF
ncbi:hypothetical protein KI387_034157, partial [Taxus chinensis]